MEFTVEIIQTSEDRYTAYCPDLELYSFGQSEEEAFERMHHIVAFLLTSLNDLDIEMESDDFLLENELPLITENRFSLFNQNPSLQ